MDIKDIKCYDPKKDGLDRQTYKTLYSELEAKNRRAAYCFDEGLTQKVLNSQVEPGLTLREFLFGKHGYLFRSQTEPVTAVFMDGQFFSFTVGRDPEEHKIIDSCAEKANSIPFIFSYDPQIDEYLRKQDAIMALGRKK